MIESRPYVPPDSIEIRIPNSILFPLQHLDDCLSGLEEGVSFTGEALEHFRESNRACQRINTAISFVEGVIGTTMLRSKTDGFKGKLAKAGSVLILAHAAVQAKGAFGKSRRQIVLDSKSQVSSNDFKNR